MDPGQTERIRKLYDCLTDIGEEAGKRIQSGAPPAGKPASPTPAIDLTAAPKVAVTASPAVATAVVGSQRRPLPLVNPFVVVGAALRTIASKPGELFGFGLPFVAILAVTSGILIEQNLTSTKGFERSPLQLLFLAMTAYVLGRWIRISRSSGTASVSARPQIGDVAIAVGLFLASSIGVDVIVQHQQWPLPLRWAAFLTKYWPLNGPYWSMAGGAQGLTITQLPPSVVLLEPVAHAAALLPILLLMPLVLRDYRNAAANWFIFLFRIPLILLAVALATAPVVILNAILANWTRELVRTGERLVASSLLSVILYMHIVLIAAVIGECYRRAFHRVP